jgi:hypothetical protein
MLALFPAQPPGVTEGKQEGCHGVVHNGPMGRMDMVTGP